MPKPERSPVLAWMAGICLVGAMDCRPSQEESPVNAYNSFAEALRKGDLKTAYAYLSADTRQAIEQRTQAVTTASGGVVKAEPANWVFGGVGRAQPLTEVKLLSQDGGTATVRAAAGSFARNITMVRERTGWKVDLTEWINQPAQ